MKVEKIQNYYYRVQSNMKFVGIECPILWLHIFNSKFSQLLAKLLVHFTLFGNFIMCNTK